MSEMSRFDFHFQTHRDSVKRWWFKR